jgi:hypothetical protein
MTEHGAGRARLGRARLRIERWRGRYGGRGVPIPEELWGEAVRIARVDGVDATARALRLDRGRLARRTDLASRSDEMGSDGFVEVDARGLCAPGPTVVRFEGRDGERLQIELSAAHALDVADLARAFWSRWP